MSLHLPSKPLVQVGGVGSKPWTTSAEIACKAIEGENFSLDAASWETLNVIKNSG